MCMACSNTGKITKKKIALFSSIAVAIGATTYFIFTTTNNPALAATIPLILSFAACPAMCAAMGGIMWLMNRKKKNIHNQNRNVEITEIKQQDKDNETVSQNFCCNMHDKSSRNEENHTRKHEDKDIEK